MKTMEKYMGIKLYVRFGGSADLPLHTGHVPPWLLQRMRRLARLVLEVLYMEHGEGGIVERLANPIFFQAFNNLIGMDWDSSGSTTVTTAVIREALRAGGIPVRVAGGKGARALAAPEEILEAAEEFGIDGARLVEASRLAAKVDNVLVQDGYSIYHHAFVVSRDGTWAVIQQGMNPHARMARRYHWLNAADFFDDPHSGIVGIRQAAALNLASSASRENRRVVVELAAEGPQRVARDLALLAGQSTLLGDAPRYHPYVDIRREVDVREVVRRIPPRGAVQDLKDLLLRHGVGPKTVRALALVAELVYRAPADWRDPANVDPFKFAFAVGGKDGVPYPVDRRTYDELIALLEAAIERARRMGESSLYRYLASLAHRAAQWSYPREYRRPT